jgi:hypothetical protein
MGLSTTTEGLTAMATTLTWRESKDRVHEFLDNDDTVAKLSSPKGSKNQSLGQAGEHEWSFRRNGVLRPTVTATRAGSDDVVATSSKERKQTYLSVGDTKFVWSGGLSRKRFVVSTADDVDLLVFDVDTSRSRVSGSVTLADDFAWDETTGLLLLFGAYLVLLAKADEDATIAGSLAAVIATS